MTRPHTVLRRCAWLCALPLLAAGFSGPGAPSLLPVAVAADVAADPQAEMEKVSRELFAAIDKNRDAIRRDVKKAYPLVDGILLPHFDIEHAAQLVLGPNWRTATPEQRQRFTAALHDMLLKTYSGALADMSSDQLRLMPFRPDASPDLATVRTEVKRASGTVVPVDYKLRRTADGWKVFDLIIEGISYVKNYRTDLGAEISQKGLDAVIARLEREARDTGKSP